MIKEEYQDQNANYRYSQEQDLSPCCLKTQVNLEQNLTTSQELKLFQVILSQSMHQYPTFRFLKSLVQEKGLN